MADRLDSGLCALKWGQIGGLAGRKIHTVDPPVLITSLVLEIQDVLVCVSP